LTKPVSRNYWDPARQPIPEAYGGGYAGRADFQSGNGQDQNAPYAGLNRAGGSPCGDAGSSAYHSDGWHYAGRDAKDPLGGTLSPTYETLRNDKTKWGTFDRTKGTFDVSMTITAYHGGKFGLYMCPWHPGALDFDYIECGIFGMNSMALNTSSPFFVGEYELPENYKLCENCEDEQQHPRIFRNGRWWATSEGGKLCGFSDPIVPNQPWPSLPNGCQGPADAPSRDGTSHHTVKDVKIPSALTTKDAVLVWHWITDNQGSGVTDIAEQFMNCADMTSVGNGPSPSPSPSPLSSIAPGSDEMMPVASR